MRDLLQRFYRVKERQMQPEEPRRKAELRRVDLEERRKRADLAWIQTNLRQIQTEEQRMRGGNDPVSLGMSRHSWE